MEEMDRSWNLCDIYNALDYLDAIAESRSKNTGPQISEARAHGHGHLLAGGS